MSIGVEYQRTTCRICDHVLPEHSILNLGPQLVSDFPDDTILQTVDIRKVPLDLVRCIECDLVQLRHTTPRDWHYKGDYWYRSGVNEMMVSALDDIARSVTALVPLRSGDVVIDIGANDGTLLSQLREHCPTGTQFWAIEPAPQFTSALEGIADVVVPNYYPADIDVKAKVITSIAMFYDLDDPHAFVEAIKQNLAQDGVWVVQFTDLQATYEQRDIGNLCHEHLCYYSLYPLERLLHDHGLSLLAVDRNKVNGGSMRAAIVHRGTHLEHESVEAHREAQMAACHRGRDIGFRRAAEQMKQVFHQSRKSLVKEGCLMWDVYGASTKGNTLLQWLELGPAEIRQALERSDSKWGRYTVNGIPIVSEEEGRERPADVWLVLPWHFRPAIIQREVAYLYNGGRMLFPLPYVEIVAGRQK